MGQGKSHNYNNLQDTDLHMMNSNYLGVCWFERGKSFENWNRGFRETQVAEERLPYYI